MGGGVGGNGFDSNGFVLAERDGWRNGGIALDGTGSGVGIAASGASSSSFSALAPGVLASAAERSGFVPGRGRSVSPVSFGIGGGVSQFPATPESPLALSAATASFAQRDVVPHRRGSVTSVKSADWSIGFSMGDEVNETLN